MTELSVRRGLSVQRGWLALVGVLPVLLALYTAVRGTRTHLLLDYWHVLAKVTDDEGGLLPGMLTAYHLEQPFVVPSLLFWLDARFFGGDNRVLTVLAIVLLVGVVAALWSMLPPGQPVLVAGFCFVLFSPHATELWVQATNGISWMPAVFFAVTALALAHRGRWGWAYAAAALATVSFGAAMPVWFALAVVAWLRRERFWVPAVIGVVVAVVWLATKPGELHSGAVSSLDPANRVSVVLTSLGGLFTSRVAEVAVLAGAVVVTALVALVTNALARRDPAAAGWAGLACYAVGIAVLIGLGRTTGAGNVGLVSRYSLVCALALCAVAGLVAVLGRVSWQTLTAATAAVAVASFGLGGAKADDVRRNYAPLGVVTAAMVVDAPGALAELHVQPGVLPAARALGMHPFDGPADLGCGLGLGASVSAVPMPVGSGVVDTVPVVGDRVLRGWAAVDGRPADCVLVLEGAVVGGGLVGLHHPGLPAELGAAGWRAVARPGVVDARVVVGSGGRFYTLTGS